MNLEFKNAKGIKYTIRFRKPDKRLWGEDCDGVCFFPTGGEETHIKINPHRTNQTIFNTIIHEVTHAFFEDKTEAETFKFANTLSRLLFNDLQFRSHNLQQLIIRKD